MDDDSIRRDSRNRYQENSCCLMSIICNADMIWPWIDAKKHCCVHLICQLPEGAGFQDSSIERWHRFSKLVVHAFKIRILFLKKKLENVVILHLPSSIKTFISNVLFYTLFFIKKDLHRGKKHSVKHIMTLLLKAHIRIFQGSTILTRIVFFISHNF